MIYSGDGLNEQTSDQASRRSITPARRASPVTVHEADDLVTEGPGAFLNFEYSDTEISSGDGRTQVRANKTRFADGKLTREVFEGELDGDAYVHIVDEANRQMMRTLSWFLPWLPRLRSNRE